MYKYKIQFIDLWFPPLREATKRVTMHVKTTTGKHIIVKFEASFTNENMFGTKFPQEIMLQTPLISGVREGIV